MSLSFLGSFGMRTGLAWRYRLFAIIPGGFGAFMALIFYDANWPIMGTKFFFQMLFAVYCAVFIILIPYAVYAIERVLGFLMGGNALLFDGVFFIVLKLFKYAFSGFFLLFLAPLGLLFVRNENLYAVGQADAEAVATQQAEVEQQKSVEAAALAHQQAVREEARKLVEEMRKVELDENGK